MRIIFSFFLIAVLLQSCSNEVKISSIHPVNWDKRTVNYGLPDSLNEGTTYLSVYSEIYSQTEQRTHDLTATVSLRNVNREDTVFIDKAEYFDTKGKFIRSYFDKTIYIAPMETVEIIIDENDEAGGTGANFLFEWRVDEGANEPIFEGVMISTYGQQGLSFTTQGKRIE